MCLGQSEKEKEKRRREKKRQEQQELQLKMQEERNRKALERSMQAPKKRTGRQVRHDTRLPTGAEGRQPRLNRLKSASVEADRLR